MDASQYHTVIESVLHAQQWDEATVRRVYTQVFRTDFSEPGMALLSFPSGITSHELRALMWSLKNALGVLPQARTTKHLVYLSMGRFDSQVTTKFHLDGAPDEAFLMLGYEATAVHSTIAIADYSHAAQDWGITPRELLADYNPMFADNEKRLMPYVTQLAAFNLAQSHILLLNNSALPYAAECGNQLGVMHQATIIPDAQQQRIINSTMISTAPDANNEPIIASVQQHFLVTNEITGSLSW